MAIIADLFLRFLWTISLLPEATSGRLAYFQLRVRFLTPLVELLRRSMWAWLRLEKEQSVRDGQAGLLATAETDAKRQKRACKNKAERTRRLARIADEVAALTKAVKFMRPNKTGSTRSLQSLSPVLAGGGGGGGGGGGNVDTSTSAGAGLPGVSHWDEDTDEGQGEDEEGEGDDDDEVLESQKVMQRDLVSHRSVVLEVCVVLIAFVGIGVWAAQDHDPEDDRRRWLLL